MKKGYKGRFKNLIEDFAEQVSDDLNVDYAGICAACKEYMPTETTIAIFDRDDDVIILNSNYCFMEALHLMYFSIAHELRHKWQQKNGFDFSKYKNSSKLKLKDYNRQEVEKDANTYAINYMNEHYEGWDKFGVIKNLKSMGVL